MVTEEDRAKNREWAEALADEAPPLTPEEIAGIRAALRPRVPGPAVSDNGPDLAKPK